MSKNVDLTNKKMNTNGIFEKKNKPYLNDTWFLQKEKMITHYKSFYNKIISLTNYFGITNESLFSEYLMGKNVVDINSLRTFDELDELSQEEQEKVYHELKKNPIYSIPRIENVFYRLKQKKLVREQRNISNNIIYHQNQNSQGDIIKNIINNIVKSIGILFIYSIQIVSYLALLRMVVPESVNYLLDDLGKFELFKSFLKDFKFFLFSLKFLALEFLLFPDRMLRMIGITLYNPMLLIYTIIAWIAIIIGIDSVCRNLEKIRFEIRLRFNQVVTHLNLFLDLIVDPVSEMYRISKVRDIVNIITFIPIWICAFIYFHFIKFNAILSELAFYKILALFSLVTASTFIVIPLITLLSGFLLPCFYVLLLFSLTYIRINNWLDIHNKSSIGHIILTVLGVICFVLSAPNFTISMIGDMPIFAMNQLEKLENFVKYIYLQAFVGILSPMLEILKILIRRKKVVQESVVDNSTVFVKNSNLVNIQKEKAELIKWFLSPVVRTLIKRVDLIDIPKTENKVLITYATETLHKVLLSFLKKMAYNKNNSIREDIEHAFISFTNTIRWSDFKEYWTYSNDVDRWDMIPKLHIEQYPVDIKDVTKILGLIFGFISPFHGRKSKLKLILAAANALRKGFSFYRKLAEEENTKKHGIVKGLPKNFLSSLNSAMKDQVINWSQLQDIYKIFAGIKDKEEDKIRPDIYLGDTILKTFITTKSLFKVNQVVILYIKQITIKFFKMFNEFCSWLDQIQYLKSNTASDEVFKITYDKTTGGFMYSYCPKEFIINNEELEKDFKIQNSIKYNTDDYLEDVISGNIYERVSNKNNKLSYIELNNNNIINKDENLNKSTVNLDNLNTNIKTNININNPKVSITKSLENQLKKIEVKKLETKNIISETPEPIKYVNKDGSVGRIPTKEYVPAKGIVGRIKDGVSREYTYMKEVVKPEIKEVLSTDKNKDITNNYVFVNSSTGNSKSNYKIR